MKSNFPIFLYIIVEKEKNQKCLDIFSKMSKKFRIWQLLNSVNQSSLVEKMTKCNL